MVLCRDERPPQSSSPTAVASAAAAPQGTKRWIPPSVSNKSTLYTSSLSERNDAIFRRVRGYVADCWYNLKVTPEPPYNGLWKSIDLVIMRFTAWTAIFHWTGSAATTAHCAGALMPNKLHQPNLHAIINDCNYTTAPTLPTHHQWQPTLSIDNKWCLECQLGYTYHCTLCQWIWRAYRVHVTDT